MKCSIESFFKWEKLKLSFLTMMILLFLFGMNESVYSQDNDLDGFTVAGGDCDDNDATVYPGATEIADDGIDQDCNGSDLISCILDFDMDGYGTYRWHNRTCF